MAYVEYTGTKKAKVRLQVRDEDLAHVLDAMHAAGWELSEIEDLADWWERTESPRARLEGAGRA